MDRCLHIFSNTTQIFEGLVVHDILQLILQFADDTNLFLSATTQNLQNTTQWLAVAEQNLGLKVNYEKTTMYRIGSLKETTAELYTQKALSWQNPPIDTLGIIVSTKLSEMTQMNLQPLIPKVKAVLQCWQHQNLTLMGRVLVINTLVESLFVYQFSVLSQLDLDILHQIQTDIWHFIWKGKGAKINFNILRSPQAGRRT